MAVCVPNFFIGGYRYNGHLGFLSGLLFFFAYHWEISPESRIWVRENGANPYKLVAVERAAGSRDT